MRTRNTGLCKEEGCDNPAKTRGLCNKHYLRWWQSTPKADRPDPGPQHDESLEDRLLRQTERQPNGCLHWTGCVTDFGYGQVHVEGRTRQAHAVVYETFVGPIPEGMDLGHKCHSDDESCAGGDTCMHRRCVNYEDGHLEPVSRRENLMRSRGFVAMNAKKQFCVNGHEFTPENTIVGKNRRSCKACEIAKQEAYRERQRAKRPPKPPRTECRHGHSWTPENIYEAPSGLKVCRLCTAESQKRYQAKVKAEIESATSESHSALGDLSGFVTETPPPVS